MIVSILTIPPAAPPGILSAGDPKPSRSSDSELLLLAHPRSASFAARPRLLLALRTMLLLPPLVMVVVVAMVLIFERCCWFRTPRPSKVPSEEERWYRECTLTIVLSHRRSTGIDVAIIVVAISAADQIESWPDSNVKSSVSRSGIFRQRIMEVAPALEKVSVHLIFDVSEHRLWWWLLLGWTT